MVPVAFRHLRASASAEGLHERLGRDGALIVDDLAETDLIGRITRDVAPHYAAPVRERCVQRRSSPTLVSARDHALRHS